MNTLPSTSLVLCDGSGAPFGVLRLAPVDADALKGDCIFDIHPQTALQGERSEVRWLYKRRFVRSGEHKFKVDDDGAVHVSQGDFKVVLEPTEGDHLRARLPAPPVTARWDG